MHKILKNVGSIVQAYTRRQLVIFLFLIAVVLTGLSWGTYEAVKYVSDFSEGTGGSGNGPNNSQYAAVLETSDHYTDNSSSTIDSCSDPNNPANNPSNFNLLTSSSNKTPSDCDYEYSPSTGATSLPVAGNNVTMPEFQGNVGINEY